MAGKFSAVSAAIALVMTAPAVAQSAAPAGSCPEPKLPAGELAPWASPVSLATASDAAGLGNARVQVGKAADLSLHPIGSVRLPVPAGREGGNGGLATVTIERAGTYRVALGSPGWVDLIAAGKAIKSTAHGHGPECTGIRKIVDFALEPGTYTIAISGAPATRTQLLVALRP